MARFFIDRPVFAMVIAIVIVIVGAVAIPHLPIATYPEVVPPVVQITANYRGGNSQDLEKTVAQPIEQQLIGLDGMMYFFSRSSNDGTLTIDVTYELGTDIDLATVKTQNKVGIALPQLPPEVQREGVTVKKVSPAFLMAIALSATDDRYDSLFLSNYATINLVEKVGSIPGVGDARLAAALDYSMRIWIDPDKMAKLGLTATDVSAAIQAQNRQNPAGALGQSPAPRGTDFQYPVNATGRLVERQQFEDIILRAQPDGSFLQLKDIGRVELGAQDYTKFSRLNRKPAAAVIAYLAPGANAVETAARVQAFMVNAAKNFPAGVEYKISYDSTRFVNAAISDVLKTLLQAIALVVLVVFIFLQNWRATLIPLLTVPVAIVGTFALFPFLGFTINMTSMFGLVLAIGIVVDDSIVVVEAVQHNIDRGMAPRDATIKAMSEVSGPVVAIAFILAAVFIPVAFLGGISGQIYRQFALTIAVSVLLSAFNALSLSPALSALILRPKSEKRGVLARLFGGFNRGFDWTRNRYLSGVKVLIRRSAFALIALACFSLGAGALFKILPKGFLPEEDQGVFFVGVRLPDGASSERNSRVTAQVEQIVKSLPGVLDCTTFGGRDIATATYNSNVSTVIVALTPWDERKSKELQLNSILKQAQRQFNQVEGAIVFAFGLPPILGLSTSGGFEFMLEDRAGGDVRQLADAAQDVLDASRQHPELANLVSTLRTSVPQYKVDVDIKKVQKLGIPITSVYDALQTFLGGLYVNDFNRFGRTWKVLMQAEPTFRNRPDNIDQFYVRTAAGDMVPLSTLVSTTAVTGPEVIYRYNRFRASKIIGQPAPGFSSGQAAAAMEYIAAHNLPAGFGYEWTGTMYQEKLSEGKEGFIFGFAAVLVFLFLAALYESWSIPFAVVLAVPLGLFGALAGVFLRSYAYDIYTQIGIVTLIGLSAKNAILIVEFARLRREQGMSRLDAAMEAAHLRLRPILMTSFAFILGVLPLVLATGAGAASRRSLGTAVFSGMITATLLAVLIVPVLYVVIDKLAAKRRMVAVAVTTIFLSGCTVGPNYRRPAAEIPPQFRGAGQPTAPGPSLAEAKWFDLFQDDVLKRLVTSGLERNFDLRIAAERVLEARARLAVTTAYRFPEIDASSNFASARVSRIGANTLLPADLNADVSYTQAGFGLGWELDLWGRVRRLNESARAQYLATEEARRGVVTTLVADIAGAYFQLRELDLELEISRKTRNVAEHGLRLTTVRKQGGAAAGLDVKQAEQLLYTATARISGTERAIGQTEDALSVLAGNNPADVPRGKSLEEFPTPAQVPAGLPSALLEQRPDIRAAEQSLIAANAQIGAAKALYFPQISLTGLAGGQSRALAQLFTGPAGSLNFVPVATLPIIDAGKVRSNVRVSQAVQREAALAYQKAIQNAFREVSDALIGYQKTTEQRHQQELLVGALRESTRLSDLRYRGGMDSYLQVLDSQRNLFQGELALAQLRRDELLAVVQLYRALGGGWQ